MIYLKYYREKLKSTSSQCVVFCEVGDNACFQNCAREYAENLKNCPCQEKCPTGCPCPNYQCPATTTVPSTTTTTADLKTWILVLNTRKSENKPLIIDGNGQSKEIGFIYGTGTEVASACSVIWRGEMYVFGGYTHQRQISMVDQCQLTRIGDLPFNMYHGACAQRNDQEVFICFEVFNEPSTSKNCYLANGPLDNFSSLPNSTYEHSNTRIAVNSGKSLLVRWMES